MLLSHWASRCRRRRDHRRDHPLFADAAAAAGSLPAAAEVTVAVHQLQRFIAIIVGLFPVAPEEAHGRVRQTESPLDIQREAGRKGRAKGQSQVHNLPQRRRRRQPHTQRGAPAPAGPVLLAGCVRRALRPSPPVSASLPGGDWSGLGKSHPDRGYRQEPGPFGSEPVAFWRRCPEANQEAAWLCPPGHLAFRSSIERIGGGKQ